MLMYHTELLIFIQINKDIDLHFTKNGTRFGQGYPYQKICTKTIQNVAIQKLYKTLNLLYVLYG